MESLDLAHHQDEANDQKDKLLYTNFPSINLHWKMFIIISSDL